MNWSGLEHARFVETNSIPKYMMYGNFIRIQLSKTYFDPWKISNQDYDQLV